ncbi:MAG: MYXO-CTERM sorting domain-containing protein [Nannocystaceae bacterium]|nr:MYXO-CTERM sorting domain-containing protein [bacterium]
MRPHRVRLRRPPRGEGSILALLGSAAPVVLLGALAMTVGPQPVRAAPPSGTDFTIQYWTTNADGSRGRQMTANDLRGYVNKARCECGQAVSARVRLSSSEALDAVPVRTFVGNRCDQGQLGNNAQARPCALAIDDFTNTYTRNIDFEFNPLWLASGVTSDGPRDINSATAAATCDAQTGDGGIWVCVENLDQPDCQPEEFVVTGQQTEVTDADGNTPSLTYDFLPPTINATNFRAQGGDGSVVIKWDNSTTTDIQGYRALCANADGSPVDGKGFSLSSVTQQNNGTVYFTAENLCPDGPFDQVDVDPDPDPIAPDTDSGTDTDTGDSTDGGDTDGDTDGGVAELEAEPDWARGSGEDCCTAGVCSDAPCIVAVQTQDASCDAQNWGESCAALATDYCSVCGGDGSCCLPNDTPSCLDTPCAVTVCGDNPDCCNVRWDETCASAAETACANLCAPPDDSTTSGGTSGDPATDTDSTTTGGDTGGETDTDTGGLAGYDTTGIESLDWAYVCSDFIAQNASTARIDGLQNDQEYQVLLVAFDYAGNPVAASDVFIATPRETTDLWEQCDAQGEICGKGGFCSVTTQPNPKGPGWLLLTGLFAMVARRRRSAGGHA